MKKAFLIDFDDSFTRNIAAELNELEVDCEILPSSAISDLVKFPATQNQVVILGPGPGHPNEHQKIFSSIRDLQADRRTYVMGICLGHQLWWAAHGSEISKGDACHGHAISLVIPEWEGVFCKSDWGKTCLVQRYNSLKVGPGEDTGPDCTGKIFENKQLMMSYGPRFITYQFHPESVGTTCPKTFLMPVRNFLYNNLHVDPRAKTN